MRKAMISSEPIISRRITAYFRTTHKKIRSWIIQCYALTNGAEDDDKDNLYNLLRQVISKSEEKDVVIIMVDLDAALRVRNLESGEDSHQNDRNSSIIVSDAS